MKVDGTKLLACERAMSEVILVVFRDTIAMSSPSTKVQEVESGGFPTVGLQISRGATPVAPVVVFKAAAKIGSQWLADQSSEWASKALAQAAAKIAVAMAREAISRPDGTAAVGIDRSSVSASFRAQEPPGEGFVMSFSVGLAVYPPREQDGIVVDTEQEFVDLGMFEIESKLPDESAEVMGKIQDSIKAAASSNQIDEMFAALQAAEAEEDLFW